MQTKTIFQVVAVAALGYLFLTIDSTPSNASPKPTGTACQSKGMAYYADIGSMGVLSDGRLVTDAVREKCARSSAAFN